MSGWGCLHQVGDLCVRVRKECSPGMLGCVLRGKVVFISEVESKPAKKSAAPATKRLAASAKRKQSKPRILAKRAPAQKRQAH